MFVVNGEIKRADQKLCLIPFLVAPHDWESLWQLAFIFLVQDNDKRAVFEKFYANKFGCQIFQRKSSCSAIGTEQDGGDEDGDQDDEKVKNGDKILRNHNYNIGALDALWGRGIIKNQFQNYNYDSWSHLQVRKAVFMYAHDNIAVVKVCAKTSSPLTILLQVSPSTSTHQQVFARDPYYTLIEKDKKMSLLSFVGNTGSRVLSKQDYISKI